jgi:hypothetical protein
MKEWNTYYCIYNVELEELRLAMNNMWRAGKVCMHLMGTCPTSSMMYVGSIELWENIVCVKNEADE